MSGQIRYYPPGTIVEVTNRTVQSRFLLRPSEILNVIVLGILGCALARHPDVRLLGFVFLSNHFHLLLRVLAAEALPAFMGLATSKLAREVATLYRWDAPVFPAPYTAIPVLDDLALVDRQRYIMSHGCKEHLVAAPEDWPGVSALPTLVHGETLSGTWFDRKAEGRARRRGKAPSPCATRYEVAIDPLPCLGHLSPSELGERYASMLLDIKTEAHAELQRTGKQPLGVEKVLALNPHSVPLSTKRAPAPLCHTSDPGLRRWYEEQLCQVKNDFQRASALLRGGQMDVEFPLHTFPPAPRGTYPSCDGPAPASVER